MTGDAAVAFPLALYFPSCYALWRIAQRSSVDAKMATLGGGRSARRALLQANSFFRHFDASIIDRLVAHAVTHNVKKGTVLFRKGDPGTTLYAISAGAVRISVPSKEGEGAIFNLLTKGDIFGEIALLDGGSRTADAVVIENSELMAIERRDFIPLLRDYPEVAVKMIEILCSRIRGTSEQVEDIVFLDVPNRLAKAMLQLSQRSKAGPREKIRVTQRELSQMIGVSRESVNKQLRNWERMKWLKIERGGLAILAPAALANLVSNET
jgi:CRP/FNR family cyclic AMP-dependent transcriptional regulator